LTKLIEVEVEKTCCLTVFGVKFDCLCY